MKLVVILLCLVPVLSQTPGRPGQNTRPARPPAQTLPPQQSKYYDFEKAVADFSLDLHRAILRTKEKYDNVLISPLSIVSVLNLMMAGAGAQTYDELRSVLRYPPTLDDDRINNKYKSMIRILLTPNRGVDITLANRMFLHPNFFPSNHFINISNGYYFTGLETRDFSKPLQSRDRINSWVNEETRGLIPSLISQPLSPFTKMVVVNAIYFQGDWEVPFDPITTHNATFRVSSSKSLTVDMMLKIMDVPYVKMNKLGIKCKMIGLPYKTTNFGLFVILPDEEGIEGLEKLESRLNADRLIEMIFEMKRETVNIRIPRMKESEHASLVASLRNLGLNTLFDPNKVNLDRINARGDLRFNDCIHQAEIDINEEGTTAAAATAVTSIRIAASANFTADRPFLYFIRDNITGAILFWGRQVWPSLASKN